MQLIYDSRSTMIHTLMTTISEITPQELVSEGMFEAVEAIIKAGEAASKLIYGENK